MGNSKKVSRREIKLRCKILQLQVDAGKKEVGTAMEAAEKVITKNELSLKEYKVGANEWRNTVQDLVSRMPTRTEIDSQFKLLESGLSELKESRSAEGGKEIAQQRGQANTSLWIGLVVAWIFSAAGILTQFFFHK